MTAGDSLFQMEDMKTPAEHLEVPSKKKEPLRKQLEFDPKGKQAVFNKDKSSKKAAVKL